MGRKAVITKYNNFMLCMLFENNRETAIELCDPEKPVIGSIYAGRVRDVVPEIDAAFIDVNGTVCYFSIKENPRPIFLNIKNNDRICQGDLIICELSREAVKTKGPVVSGNISISDRYAVLDTSLSGQCSISKKITENKRSSELKELCRPFICDAYGFIMRTECMNASDKDINECLSSLSEKYNEIIKKSKHAQNDDILYEPEPEIIRIVSSFSLNSDDEIVTDIRSVYEMINGRMTASVRFYEDRFLPLFKLYSMEKRLTAATSRRVWLKSGGYLVIDPAEALTVIDVNTGKTVSHSKDKEEIIFKTNMEACHEIARQLVLRNISGIIIVDFINMKNNQLRDEIGRTMKSLLSKDHVKASFVDFTRLDLMEITRQRVKRPLYEVLKEISNGSEGYI